MSDTKTLSFTCCLITGGSGGLGKAMAASLIGMGKKVIIAGRTKDKLEAAAKEIRATAYYVLDTSDTASIPQFVERLIQDHPDVDAIINNAGVQRPFRFPGTEQPNDNYNFDLSKADAEIDVNIRGPMHLVVDILPHFQKLASQGKPSCIMNVSSVLGFIPTSVINPVYNGTKAWAHFFTMSLRTQLNANADKGRALIKVVEIAPPSVETDLHRERSDPDDNKRAKGNQSSMTVSEFMEAVEQGWKQNEDIIAPGMAGEIVSSWYEAFGSRYAKATGQ